MSTKAELISALERTKKVIRGHSQKITAIDRVIELVGEMPDDLIEERVNFKKSSGVFAKVS